MCSVRILRRASPCWASWQLPWLEALDRRSRESILLQQGVALVQGTLVLDEVSEIGGIEGAQLQVQEEPPIGRFPFRDRHVHSADADRRQSADKVGKMLEARTEAVQCSPFSDAPLELDSKV